MGFEQPVDEVQRARTAGAGAQRQLPGHVGFATGGETADLLVADMHPFEIAAPDRVGKMIDGVANHAIAALGARLGKRFDNDFSDILMAHDATPFADD